MTKTLSGTITTEVALSVLADDPATVVAGALLSGGIAAYNLTAPWTIGIAGSVTGIGVVVHSIGTVTVASSGGINALAPSNYGVYLEQGGTVINHGRILGVGAVAAGRVATIINYGLMNGSSTGLFGVAAGYGRITNAASGTISGRTGVGHVTTVVNAGIITGAAYAVKLAQGSTDRLVADPGAVFTGTVTGGNAIGSASVSTLELAFGFGVGTLSGLGTQFVDFANVAVDGQASWYLSGSNTVIAGATVTDGGLVTLAGSLTVAGLLVNNSLFTGATGAAGTYSSTGDGGAGGLGLGSLTVTGTLTNSPGGTIQGGAGGGGGASTSSVRVNDYGGSGNAGSAGILISGGLLNNAGAIAGGAGGSGGASVHSFGGVGGRGGTGIVITAGSAFNAGLVTGGAGGAGAGISAQGAPQGGAGGYGVQISGGMLTNTGTIAGGVGGPMGGFGLFNGGLGAQGIEITGGIVLNQGSVSGGTGGAVGGYGGLGVAATAGTLINQGRITAGANDTTAGNFGPGAPGVQLMQGATLIDAGYIAGGLGSKSRGVAVALLGSTRLILEPGAKLVGGVEAAPSATVLELSISPGTAAGTLAGIGSAYKGFTQISVDPAAAWTLTGAANSIGSYGALTNSGQLTLASGTLADSGALTNDGTILLDAATMTLASLSGTGQVTIGAGSTLSITGTVSAGETIAFASGSGALTITPPAFAGVIETLQTGDQITLSGVTDATSAFISAPGTLAVARASHPAILLNTGSGSYPGLSASIANGNALTLDIPCFLRGTLIRTERGERRVEDLKAGERVITLSGRPRPIVWMGRGRKSIRRGRRGAATPILVTRNALADGVPFADLRLTKGHSLFVDGVLIPAEFLVNNRSIRWDDHAQTVEFHHVELDAHDVLLANGVPSESYRDDGNRYLFMNPNPSWDRRPEPPCAPVLTGGPIVDAIWRRLLGRAGPRPEAVLTRDPDLHLLADGRRVRPRRHRHGATFALPRAPREAWIISRAAVPAELGLARDFRPLGVAVRQLTVWQGRRVRALDVADCRAIPGFHDYEPDQRLRWTNGAAPLPAPLLAGLAEPVEIELMFGGQTWYPHEGPPA